MSRRISRLAAGCALVMATTCAVTVSAQTLSPSKPIRIVVPVAAGAANDILARMAGDWLQKKTGLTVIVENRTGAGGKITINPALYKKGPVDTVTDVVPVAMLADVPQILTINSKVPANNAKEFIALAKAKPGSINYGSAGPGTVPHLAVALFGKLAGIDLVHVPYRGIAPAMTDLLAGSIQAISVGNATIAPFVGAGTLRILGTAGPTRLPYLPDVPTAVDIGLPAWEISTWYAMFAPKGTPKAIADEINRHILAMFDEPNIKKRYEEGFYDIVRMNADEFGARVRSDVARMDRIVKETGLEAQ
jgi:tripartite-type tricarboxylate transporter receptor subunit TctC